ncbi:MAG: SDR family NAD(P)-dependent oxidoreductase [Chloroflexota bacterium]
MDKTKETVIITGGNSGLGYQAAKELAHTGAYQLVIASRNVEKTNAAVEELKTKTGHQAIVGMKLDLGSLDSVREFAANFLAADYAPLYALVCNAGLSPRQNRLTADGFDTTFGVNHLGHYLLSHLLSHEIADGGRLIFVSSGTHLPEKKLARRLGVPAPKYTTAYNLAYADQAPEPDRIDSPAQRYSTSKLCNVLATYEFGRQFKMAGKQVNTYALDPGLMPGTELVRDAPDLLKPIFAGLIRIMGNFTDGIREPTVSGKHLAQLVTDPAFENRSGLYFDGDKAIKSSADSYDRAKSIDLWNTSAKLCKLTSSDTILPIEIETKQAA